MIVQYNMEIKKPVSWMHIEEQKAFTKFFNNIERYYLFYFNRNHLIIRESRQKPYMVFAYFMVGNTQMLCYTTKETPIKAYKIDKNYKQTYEIWKQAKFIRYCTSMDL